MGRDHRILGERYVRDARTGFIRRIGDTVMQHGMRIGKDVKDLPGRGNERIIPPTAQFDDFHKKRYQVVWLEEFGATPSYAASEYGVMVNLDNVSPQVSISGEYGTLVYVPDYTLEVLK